MLTKSKVLEVEDPDEELILERPEWEQNLLALAENPGAKFSLGRRKDQATRKDVEKHLHQAFEMIGGVSRLSLWADQYPTEFFRLYSKMLPKELKAEIDGEINLVVSPSLMPGALDTAPQERDISPPDALEHKTDG